MKIEIEAVEGDRAQLYQWDLNRRLILTGFGQDTQAHFGQGDSALVVAAYDDGGVLYADIPNICLQRAGMLYVYIYSPANTRTRTAAAFSVWARPKPEDYVYTDTDTLTYRKLEAKIGDLENLNTKDKSSLVSAVNEALKTSGGYGAVTYTEQNLTDAQQSQARKNIGALGTGALPDAINDALAQAKESGAFDGAPGKDGTDGKDGAPGVNGSDGVTPTIGDNGNWYLGDTDTGKPSRGETGPQGQHGEKGDTGATGPAGADGKSAYQYAVEGGYIGTEEEFAAKLAEEIPTVLPNPNALTFTGAVTGSYDGSSPLSVEIPSGVPGGIADTILFDITANEDCKTIKQMFPDGFDYTKLKKLSIICQFVPTTDETITVAGDFNLSIGHEGLSSEYVMSLIKATSGVPKYSGNTLSGYVVFNRYTPISSTNIFGGMYGIELYNFPKTTAYQYNKAGNLNRFIRTLSKKSYLHVNSTTDGSVIGAGSRFIVSGVFDENI